MIALLMATIIGLYFIEQKTATNLLQDKHFVAHKISGSKIYFVFC